MHTGLYPQHNGAMGFMAIHANVRTLNEQLHDAGYLISMVGGKAEHYQPAEKFKVDYLKQGIGQARFARFRRADELMRRALEVAGAAALHEFEFRIERIRGGLADCERVLAVEAQAAEPVMQTDELREVSASLAQLVG